VSGASLLKYVYENAAAKLIYNAFRGRMIDIWKYCNRHACRNRWGVYFFSSKYVTSNCTFNRVDSNPRGI